MGLKGWLRQFFYDLKNKNELDILVNNIVSGGCITQSPIYDVNTQLMLQEIKTRINEADTDLDKIKLMNHYYSDKEFEKILKCNGRALNKRDRFAIKLKKVSNVFYRAFDYEMAVRCCNLALMFTKSSSDLVHDLRFERAFFSYELQDYETVFQDVEASVLESGVASRKVRVEMMKLSKQSVKMLIQRSAEWREKCRFNSNYKNLGTYCDEVLFKVHGSPHPQIPSAGNCVSIVEHPVKGRILVVTQDLSAGTTVIVENPYVTVLTSCTHWELRHCCYCYKKTFALIPCSACVYATYCSERCRLTDYDSVHKYECQCLSYFHAIDLPSSVQASFRVVCKAGPDSLYQLFCGTNAVQGMAPHVNPINGFNPETGMYESDSYFQMSNLIQHGNEDFPELLIYYAYNLAKLLGKKTTFFDTIQPGDKTDFFEFIAARLLYHSMSIPYNGMRIWEDEKTELKKRVESNDHAPGTHDVDNRVNYEGFGLAGIFSLTSLFSHSCDASAIRIHKKDGKLAIITQRRVVEGEELTISYNYKYWTDDLEDRSSRLESEYKFQCTCIACLCEWSTLDEIGSNIEFICPECSDSGNYSYEEMAQRRCVLVLDEGDADSGTCENCKTKFNIPILKKSFDVHDDKLQEAKFVLDIIPVTAVQLLLECIEYFQSRIQQPSHPMINAQALLVSAYQDIASDTRHREYED